MLKKKQYSQSFLLLILYKAITHQKIWILDDCHQQLIM